MLKDGKVACWGHCGNKVLGRDCDENRYYSRPEVVSNLNDIETISTAGEGLVNQGGGHACALSTNRNVACWGSNRYGQLGNGSNRIYSGEPLKIQGLNNIIDFSSIRENSYDPFATSYCVVTEKGDVFCWGGKMWGSSPLQIQGIHDATSISSGQLTWGSAVHPTPSTCVVRKSGKVSCFRLLWEGDSMSVVKNDPNSHFDQYFEFNYNYNASSAYIEKTAVLIKSIENITDAKEVDISDTGFGCAVKQTGKIACWGSKYGILRANTDDGTLKASAHDESSEYEEIDKKSFTAIEIPSISDAIDISTNAYSTNRAFYPGGACALRQNGTVLCWQGSFELTPILKPIEITQISDAASIDSDWGNTCVTKYDGRVVCWGRGTQFAGTILNPTSPVEIDGFINVRDTFLSYGAICAVLNDNSVTCIGPNLTRWRGDFENSASIIPTLTILEKNKIKKIEGSCALYTDRTLACWGHNADYGSGVYGILGDSSNFDNDPEAKNVKGIADIISISTSSGASCAVNQKGEIFCWGYNRNNSFQDILASSTPIKIENIDDAVSVALSKVSSRACALLQTKSVICWGTTERSYDGLLYPQNLKIVDGLTDAVAISSDSCALRSNGSIACWEWSEDSVLLSVDYSGISDATSISSGYSHICALRRSGNVVCLGSNIFGQLGDSTRQSSSEPVEVSGLSDAIAISVGGNHTCAIRQNKSVVCWGSNFMGQLGVSFDDPRLKRDEFIMVDFGYSPIPLEVQGL